MTQELNLDSFANPQRTVTLAGVAYSVEDMSVDNFIATTLEAAEFEKRVKAGNPPTIAEQVSSTVRMVSRAVPTMPVELLNKLSLDQLGAIAKFVRGVDPTKDEDEGDEVEGEDGKK